MSTLEVTPGGGLFCGSTLIVARAVSRCGEEHWPVGWYPIMAKTFTTGERVNTNKPSLRNMAKKPCRETCIACLWCISVSCSSRYCITLLYLLGGRASMHTHEADLTKTGGRYCKARLYEVLHVPPYIKNGQHMFSLWSCVKVCAHGCERLTACLQLTF